MVCSLYMKRVYGVCYEIKNKKAQNDFRFHDAL